MRLRGHFDKGSNFRFWTPSGSGYAGLGVRSREASDACSMVLADIPFFLVGPFVGAVISAWSYSSGFLFALASVLASLGIVLVPRQVQRNWSGSPPEKH